MENQQESNQPREVYWYGSSHFCWKNVVVLRKPQTGRQYFIAESVKMNCLAKDRNGDACRNKQMSTETSFCRVHQYMNDYTDEMLHATQFCSSCKKMHYIAGGFKSCETCRARKMTNPEVPIIRCKFPDCKFKKSEENDYCGKHQLQVFVESTHAAGLKLCSGYLRGCREQLPPTYEPAKCISCLEKENMKDRERRAAAKDATPLENGYRICTSCCRELPMDAFQGTKTETKTCVACREQNKIQDAKRSGRQR